MKQQIARRNYTVPRRASAINAATTQEEQLTRYSPRNRHHKYDAGMDMVTTRTQNPYRYKAPADQEWFDIDEEENEPVYQTKPPRSAVVIRRPYTHVEPVTRTEDLPGQRYRRQLHPLVYIGISMLIAVVFIAGYIYIPSAWQRHVDDVTYSYPRTFQTDANVGHGGISHFIVLNLHGTIEVIEIPQDQGKFAPHIYIIVRFTNQGADLVPATVAFTDVNGGGKPDMQVTVYNGTNPTIYILFNNGSTFVPHL